MNEIGQKLTDAYPLCKLAMDVYGKEAQYDQTVEECAELIVALNHLKRGRIGNPEVVTEIADVFIMLMQMVSMFDENAVVAEIDVKLKKMEKQMSHLIDEIVAVRDVAMEQQKE